MTTITPSFARHFTLTGLVGMLCLGGSPSRAATATVLFSDDFNGGIPGWTAVQPPGNYFEGPMLWEYDQTSASFSEQSNIYTDSSAYSTNRVAVMLINQTVTTGPFTYSARLTAADNDGFGLIFGYQNETTFYRVTFAQQNDAARNTHWPFTGWDVDRMNERQITDLFGVGATNGYTPFYLTLGRPFDVTLSVTNSHLTLLVLDDPDGAAIPYDLVVDQPLPTTAAGRVGIFSWGMGAATVGNVRSFRVQNVALSPTPLTGDPAHSVLTNWSFLITPRSDGTIPVTTAGGPPIWAQGLGPNGDHGTMIENSDWTADNTNTATTYFAAPTAVAGDVNWSNYVYSARFISADNDGFGMLLRYQDETNFYRIAFRNQASTSGVKQGISIQRNVNLTFDQIFSSTAFLPPIYTPMDAYASIRTNRLEIVIVSNPLSAAAQMYAFGPFDLDQIGSGSTIPRGRIGVFSWAQFQNVGGDASSDAGTEVDWVKVSAIAGQSLLVASAYGTPNPPPGLSDLPTGAAVTASVDAVVLSQPGVRQVSTGWSGVGSVPASGATNQVAFTLNSFSSILWKWRTEVLLSVSATAGGTVNMPGDQFLPQGTNVVLTATPNPGYIFLGWTGASSAVNTNLAFPITRPTTLTARFAADSDGDGLPDSWELAYFGTLSWGATDDPDHDGRDNLTEYLQGTDPTFAEVQVFSDGLTSQWVNEQRDPALPGRFVVTNAGPGFRGVWENSNQNRYANDTNFIGWPFITSTNYPQYAGFQGPLLLVRSNLWNPVWANVFSLQAEFSVGDDDGVCLYFRYLNESNWFRVTVDGQAQNDTSPLQGISIQSRTNGYFNLVASDAGLWTDPLDTLGYKRIRVTVNASNDTFEVRVIGWDAIYTSPPDWNPGSERVLVFTDPSIPTGRIGLGCWGMDTFTPAATSTNGNPLDAGMLADNIRLTVGGTNAFIEDWETARQSTDFPPGWVNAYAGWGPGSPEADWEILADGAIGQLSSNSGRSPTGTLENPKADADGPILLAPALTNANYWLDLGLQSYDDDGIGFVYDFADTNNFSRVLFDSQAPVLGNLPQGLNVSRKSGGAWSDLIVGDTNFVYTPGRAFRVQFANNNGTYTLRAWNVDAPATVYRWQWTGPATSATNRFGLAVWACIDAHFTSVRASALPAQTPAPFKVTRISRAGDNLVLDISKPVAALYHVQRASQVGGPYVNVATNLSAAQYTEPLPAARAFYRLQLAQ